MQDQSTNPIEAQFHTVEWTAALAKKAMRGDPAAFDKLVDLFWPDIYRMVYFRSKNPMDAEDLAQEVFLRAYASLDRLRKPESFRSWLFSIAINLVRDFHRRGHKLKLFKSLNESSEERSPEPADQYSESALDGVLRHEFWQEIKSFTQQLPEKEREVFSLRFLDQLSIKEIAQVLDRAEGSIKSHLFRAVAKLRRRSSLLELVRGEL
jgi:RNA polymerase sigma-70 factor (ECF subfamily)